MILHIGFDRVVHIGLYTHMYKYFFSLGRCLWIHGMLGEN